jgi:sorbitol-specific phosphotransferase system component IIBC
MNKKVNIYPKNPITTVNPVIRTTTLRVSKPVEDIRKCIIARAMVDEVLDDGTTLRLDLNNYDKDNNPTKTEKNADGVKAAPVPEKIEERPEVVIIDEDKNTDETEEEAAEAEEDNTSNDNNNQQNRNNNNKKNKNNKFNNQNNGGQNK